MFGKVDKKKIEQNNRQVEQELKVNKPTPQEVDSTKGRDVAGNILSVIGTMMQVVGGVGAAVLILNYLASALGLSILVTIALLIGIGLAVSLIGNKLLVNDWFPQIIGV